MTSGGGRGGGSDGECAEKSHCHKSVDIFGNDKFAGCNPLAWNGIWGNKIWGSGEGLFNSRGSGCFSFANCMDIEFIGECSGLLFGVYLLFGFIHRFREKKERHDQRRGRVMGEEVGKFNFYIESLR